MQTLPIHKFVKALWQVWTAELVLSFIVVVWGAEDLTAISIVPYAISSIVLPLLAGLSIVKVGGGIGVAVLGGASISVVSVLSVAVYYLIISAGFVAFFGYVAVTLIFTAGLQAIFGCVGGLLGRKVFRNAF